MATKTSAFRLGLAVLLLGGAAAAAAAPVRSKFSPGETTIVRAGVLVNEATGTQFRIGQDLMVTIRANPAARGLARRIVGVRLFPLGPGERRPHPWASFDPCNVYFARLFGARASNYRINLGNLETLDYLTVTPGGVSKGRFLLVFEAGAVDAGPMFRINKTDEQAYFGAGLYIEVLPTRSYGASEISGQRARVGTYSNALQSEANRNDPSRRCYRIRTVTADGTPSAELAYVGDCEREDEAAGSPGV